MLESLLPQLDHVVFTRPANPRSLSPATLVTLAEKLGGPPVETVPGPQAALARARELAGPDGAVLAAGSIYLIADLVREARTRAPRRCSAHALRGPVRPRRRAGGVARGDRARMAGWALRTASMRMSFARRCTASGPWRWCARCDRTSTPWPSRRRSSGGRRRMSAGLRAIPGAAEALGALREDRVAVVTSATRALAAARLGAVGIELPAVVVYAGDVSRGQAGPRGLPRRGGPLGVDPAHALVVEDSPPGIEAGRAAGAATVGVTSTHAASELTAADVVIEIARGAAWACWRAIRCGRVLANDGH